MFRPFSLNHNGGDVENGYHQSTHVPQYQNQSSWYQHDMDWQSEPRFHGYPPYMQGLQQGPNFGFGADAPIYMPFDDCMKSGDGDDANEDGELYEEEGAQNTVETSLAGKSAQGNLVHVEAAATSDGNSQLCTDSAVQSGSIPGIATQAMASNPSAVPDLKATVVDRAAELRARLIASREAKTRATPAREQTQEVNGSSNQSESFAVVDALAEGPQRTDDAGEDIKAPSTQDGQEHDDHGEVEHKIESPEGGQISGVIAREQQSRQIDSSTISQVPQGSVKDLDDLLAQGRAAAEAEAMRCDDVKVLPNGISRTTSPVNAIDKGISIPDIAEVKNWPTEANAKKLETSDASTEPGEIRESPTDERQDLLQDPAIVAQQGNARSAPLSGNMTSRPYTNRHASQEGELQQPRAHRSTSLPRRKNTTKSQADRTDQALSESRRARSERLKQGFRDDKCSSTVAHAKGRPVPLDDALGETISLQTAVTIRKHDAQQRSPHARRRTLQTPVETTEPGTARQVHNPADLEDWLEITGYHDQAYRKRSLHRHRRKRELEQQIADLEHEAELEMQERVTLVRAQSVRPKDIGRGSTLLNMPPPPVPSKDVRNQPARAPSPVQLSPFIATTRNVEQYATFAAAAPSVKRALSISAQEPPEKFTKTASTQQAGSVDDREITFAPRPEIENARFGGDEVYQGYNIRNSAIDLNSRPLSRAAFPTRTYERRSMRTPSPSSAHQQYISAGLDPLETYYGAEPRIVGDQLRPTVGLVNRTHMYSRPSSPEPPEYGSRPSSRGPSNYGGRRNFRPRGSSYQAPRLGKYATPLRQDADISASGRAMGGSNNFRKGGTTRYFLIKSWTRNNVDIAQREGIWATQEKNADTFKEAFDECDDVILVFSVNKSMAFQGYARMITAPSASIPAPSWSNALLWPTSPPFYVEWISIAETPFSRAGHLKNELNDGLAVVVGRDGQEIEERCGRELCKIIKQIAEDRYAGR